MKNQFKVDDCGTGNDQLLLTCQTPYPNSGAAHQKSICLNFIQVLI